MLRFTSHVSQKCWSAPSRLLKATSLCQCTFSTTVQRRDHEFDAQSFDFDHMQSYYKENGFVVAKNLFNNDQVQEIKSEMARIVTGQRSTLLDDPSTEVKINGIDPKFIEKYKNKDINNALSQKEIENEIYSQFYCIHFPHKISDIVLKYSAEHDITNSILECVMDTMDIKMIQTMMFFKGPGHVGQNWHQDEYYIPTRDTSLTGVWIAIEDTNIKNGCLWVVPKSHRKHILYPTKDHKMPHLFDGTPMAFGFENNYDDEIAVELNKGDGIFFNGYLLHRSLKNETNDKYRLSFANHYMNANSYLPWNYDNRLKGYIEDVRDFVMVSGNDPYQYKGKEHLHTTNPFVRGTYSYKPSTD